MFYFFNNNFNRLILFFGLILVIVISSYFFLRYKQSRVVDFAVIPFDEPGNYVKREKGNNYIVAGGVKEASDWHLVLNSSNGDINIEIDKKEWNFFMNLYYAGKFNSEKMVKGELNKFIEPDDQVDAWNCEKKGNNLFKCSYVILRVKLKGKK